ncbi:MAG: UDP-N-acetylglucosamine 2-epimerase (non-hydrolyzing) [Armatimonadota bacterium]
MYNLKIAFIVGARPQFVKLAPLMKRSKNKQDSIIIHTGQHYDGNMSPLFFKELGIPSPSYNLGIGKNIKGAEQLGLMIIKIAEVFLKEKCSLAVVFGDTTSTLAGALAAAKLGIDAVHIEAGMRSYTDMPEEENRVLTDHLCRYLFCSTQQAVKNLKKENITSEIYMVGDLMYDNLKEVLKSKRNSDILKRLGLKKKDYYLLTAHRAENTDNPKRLDNILTACSQLKKRVVFPVHPRTKNTISNNGKKYKNIEFTEPVGYIDMVELLKGSDKVLTDSGGLQKEAYILGIPCITLRKETEWTELVKAGWNILAGTDKNKIKKAVQSFNPKRTRKKFYGTGRSADKIYRILKKIVKKRTTC